MNNQPWYNIALQVYGAIMLGLPLFMWLLNKGKRQSDSIYSKTENEKLRDIVERRLVELNIQEIIDKKVEVVEQKYKDMFMEKDKEHFGIKLEMQERLNKVMEEKIVVERENELLHGELSELEKKYESQQQDIKKMKKEIEILKQQQNGKN